MKDYEKFQIEQRKLGILKALSNAPAYTLNDVAFKQVLASHGMRVGTDRLWADVQWLHELSLVYMQTDADFFTATLTRTGVDVQNGLSTVHGVARPEPV